MINDGEPPESSVTGHLFSLWDSYLIPTNNWITRFVTLPEFQIIICIRSSTGSSSGKISRDTF